MSTMNRDADICWFHGKITREIAEDLLNKGNFINICFKDINFSLNFMKTIQEVDESFLIGIMFEIQTMVSQSNT